MKLKNITSSIMSSVSHMKHPRLILHFDVNQTLIMTDSAGGKTAEDIIFSSMMQNIQGTMIRNPNEWRNQFLIKMQKNKSMDSKGVHVTETEVVETEIDEDTLLKSWVEHRKEIKDMDKIDDIANDPSVKLEEETIEPIEAITYDEMSKNRTDSKDTKSATDSVVTSESQFVSEEIPIHYTTDAEITSENTSETNTGLESGSTPTTLATVTPSIVATRPKNSTSTVEEQITKEAQEGFEHDPTSKLYMSFETYLHEHVFPYEENHPENATMEEILAERQIKKHWRKEFTRKFLKYFPHHEEMYKSLKQGLTYSDGSEVFIIPAFFELLLWLEENEIEYSVVFRTFGDDIAAVKEEFNKFCAGEHPQFPHQYENLKKKMLLDEDPTSQGYFHRSEENVTLVVGDKDQPKDINHQFVENEKFKIIKGEKEIYSYIKEVTATGKTMALRDFYPYWSLMGEKPEAGKVFLVDKNDPEILQLFFDDNIFIAEGRGIVDLRDVTTNTHMHLLEEYNGVCLKHVELSESLSNRKFFIESIEYARKQRFEKK